MSVIREEDLIKEISLKRFSRVYLIYGNDSFLPKYYCDKIADMTCTGDPFFNKQKFLPQCDLQEVYDAVIQYPMMADSKSVVLYDYDFVKCDKSDFERLLSLVSEVPEGCVFIMLLASVEFDAKKDSRFKKLVSVTENNKGKVVCLDHRTVTALSKMMITGAKKRGLVLSDKNARLIIEKCGEDISFLRNELDKLCAYKNSGEIEKSDIENICVNSIEASVYDYVERIVSGNLSGALKILDDMFYLKIEPMIILYSVSSVYVDMYRAYTSAKSGKTRQDIADDFGYKARAFVIGKAFNYLKKYDFQKLNDSFKCLLDTDKSLKSGNGNDRQKLEEMTVRLSLILRGETLK